VSAIDRALGIIRSLAIYRGIPLRQRRLRRLYAPFVPPGSLTFDIGAHAGNRVRALADLGCRVVAVEPQPAFAELLRAAFRRTPSVTIVEAAVSDEVGRRTLLISDRTPTVTTIDEGWRAARARDADFAGVEWNRTVDVDTLTLDALIERFGTPAFVKIDVEGSEPAVLRGLTQPIPALSFEYLPQALGEVERSVARLEALSPYEYNWSLGETGVLASKTWLSARAVLEALRTPLAQQRPGDVYARQVMNSRARSSGPTIGSAPSGWSAPATGR